MPQHQQEKQVPESKKAAEQASATTAIEEKIIEENVTTPRPTTLPELLGRMTETLLTALQGDQPAPKQQAIQGCLRDMRIWYDSQPVEGRKELAKAARKQLEQFKLVGEQFFQEMMTITAQDVQ